MKDHFDIHYFGEYDEHKKSTFKIRQEYDLQIICGYLKADFPQQKIGIYIYPTKEALQQARLNHDLSISDFDVNEYRIYRVWGATLDLNSYPHEITKAVAHMWSGLPIVFFQEGLATAVDDLAFGYKLQVGEERKWLDDYIRDQLTKGNQFPSISSLFILANLTHPSLNSVIAGSFVKFLIQKYGIEKFREFYRTMVINNLDKISLMMAEVFGETVDNLESSWKQSLLKS